MAKYILRGKSKMATVSWDKSDDQFIRYNPKTREFLFSFEKKFMHSEALDWGCWVDGPPEETMEFLKVMRKLVKVTTMR